MSSCTPKINSLEPQPAIDSSMMTITTTQTIMPKNTLTQTPIKTSTEENNNRNPKYFALVSPTSGEVQVYDLNGTLVRKYDFRSKKYVPVAIQVIQNSCKMYITLNKGNGVELVKIDLEKGQTDVIFSNQHLTGEVNVFPSVSANEKWLSYVSWTGEMYYDEAQFHDIKLQPITDSENQIQLTINGGAWKKGGQWAPVNNLLAFSDFDSGNFLQLYIYNPTTGEINKISDNQTPSLHPGPVYWSPNEEFIAWISYHMNETNQLLPVLRIYQTSISESYKEIELPLSSSTIPADVFWNLEDNEIALFLETHNDDTGIYWFDFQTGNEVSSFTLHNAMIAQYKIHDMFINFPVREDLTLFYLIENQSIYRIDKEAMSLTLISHLSDTDNIYPLMVETINDCYQGID